MTLKKVYLASYHVVGRGKVLVHCGGEEKSPWPC